MRRWLGIFTDDLWIERMVLQHLRDRPNGYAGALRRIPRTLLRILTHSAQSQAFNDALREAVLSGNVPETFKVEGFHVAEMPDLSICSIRRRSYLDVRGFRVLMIDDGVAKIRFSLVRGEYATTLLSYLAAM